MRGWLARTRLRFRRAAFKLYGHMARLEGLTLKVCNERGLLDRVRTRAAAVLVHVAVRRIQFAGRRYLGLPSQGTAVYREAVLGVPAGVKVQAVLAMQRYARGWWARRSLGLRRAVVRVAATACANVVLSARTRGSVRRAAALPHRLQ